MKSKLIIICLLLIFLSTLSSVAAEDLNNTHSIQDINTDNFELEQIKDDEMMAADDSSNLQNIINNASEGSSIKLSKNYLPDKDLKIDKSITLDGAGNVIDSSKAGFEISNGVVTLKNLIFK